MKFYSALIVATVSSLFLQVHLVSAQVITTTSLPVSTAPVSVHDAQTAETINKISAFCRRLRGFKAVKKCKKLRNQFASSIKARASAFDSCGPTKVAIKFETAFRFSGEARQLAFEMSQARANIQPAGAQRGVFVFGQGQQLTCGLRV